MDVTPVAPAAWVDTQEETLGGDRTKPAANDPMDVNQMRQSSWSEAEKSGAADIMHKKLLEQMPWLCRILQDMGNRMEGKIEHEGLERLQENQKFIEEMCQRMDEGCSKMMKVPENSCRMI